MAVFFRQNGHRGQIKRDAHTFHVVRGLYYIHYRDDELAYRERQAVRNANEEIAEAMLDRLHYDHLDSVSDSFRNSDEYLARVEADICFSTEAEYVPDPPRWGRNPAAPYRCAIELIDGAVRSNP